MHSSRMRTARAFTVCWSLLPGGWGTCLVQGGVPAWSGRGVPAWSQGGVPAGPGGYLPGPGGTCLVWGGVLGQVLPPPLWTE